VISEARPEVRTYYRGQPANQFPGRRVANDLNFQLMEDFARAIDTDGTTILDAQVGRDIAATVEAALASAQSGQSVEVQSIKRTS